MPLASKDFKNQPHLPNDGIPAQVALQSAWAKVGQLTFQVDVMSQQLQAFEQENRELKEKLKAFETPKGTNVK